ncbi:cytochrome C oxidase subunit IV family protein [Pseudomonas mangrovi]|uniref:Cytochrome C oxidase subunit IV n=1 Tax=Pseudomonas mangrovi TaxID=2161748 RepID=A0A2T5PAB5_9PSED|nr:cytochrome C oxidase subunit IV family protein [Pseudomonas mangrovi]PTU74690.1 hypothetical protein DBO85_08480 [Pseudomonas mangrovi]
MSVRALLACWVALVLLSLATVASLGLPSARDTLLVLLLLVLGKAWLIVDGFMELRHAPWPWRALMLAWPVAMALGVAGAALL